MASRARVEEVEDDSDVDMSDPSEGDIDDFVDSDIVMRRAAAPNPRAAAQAASSARPSPASARQHILDPSTTPLPAMTARQQQQQAQPNAAVWADFQCLYPVYFDANRTRAQGRRVASSHAVANPLAVEIKRACEGLGLPTVLEVHKLHPKDWANPGRVKVALKKVRDSATAGLGPVPASAREIKNKHHLYLLVAAHLKAHPTTEEGAALRFNPPGAGPAPPHVTERGKAWPRPAVPRGWTMGELLPFYSPAMTGGGVSENLFKDMMKEMQGGGGDMASLLNAAGAGAGAGPSGSGAGGEEKKGKG